MPLLVVALIATVVYKAVADGLHWGADTSRKAWEASMDRSRKAHERLAQAAADRLKAWSADPGWRGYAAWWGKVGYRAGRGLGKAGAWSALRGARASGASLRGLAAGAILSAGLAGSMWRGARRGAANGAEWWETRARRRSARAHARADRAKAWGRTVNGEAVDRPANPETPRPQPAVANPPATPIGGQIPRLTTPPRQTVPPPPPPPRPPRQPGPQQSEPRAPYYAGTATAGRPLDPAPESPDLTDRLLQHLAQGPPGSTEAPRPPIHVGTATVGAPSGPATAVIDPPAAPAIEGEIVTTLATTNGGAVAPIGSAADGMKYEQSLNFLTEQGARAQEMASLAEQIVALQARLAEGAGIMARDHEMAQAGLARFNVTAPHVGEAVSLLLAIAAHPGVEHMIRTFDELNQITAGCAADADDLTQRFGAMWEIRKAQNIDADYVND